MLPRMQPAAAATDACSAVMTVAAQAAAVVAGAAAGGLLRWAVTLWLNPLWGGFAIGTLAVNAVGGFGVGLAVGWLTLHPNEWLRLLAVTGFLGGLTTFSAFSIESFSLLQRGAYGLALLHTLAHWGLSLAGVAAGWAWIQRCCAPAALA